MAGLDWLIARPIAHRGLHDASAGIVENTPSAVQAAVAAGYAVEVDLQVTADGDAVVHHDEILGRVTDGRGRVDTLTAAELKRVAFRATADRMLTIGDLCDLVSGRATLVLELKSRFDGDRRLVSRICQVLATYPGRAAAMSFDPRQIEAVRALAPLLARGMVAEGRHRGSRRSDASARHGLAYLRRFAAAGPQFIAYAVNDLPAVAPLVLRRVLRLPLLAWTVRSAQERQLAQRWADQMIFEGFRPGGETPPGPPANGWMVLAMAPLFHRQTGAGDASWKATMREGTMSATELRIRVVPAIAEIAAAQWDACADPNGRNLPAADSGRAPPRLQSKPTQPRLAPTESISQECEYNPFISHAFLHALEASGSAAAKTGWQPQHLVAETADGRLLGALPCYLKSHSRGEYVFDHGWADAYERAG